MPTQVIMEESFRQDYLKFKYELNINCSEQRCFYTVRSESRCALRLRYVKLVVRIEVAVEVCCYLTVFSCQTAVEVQYR
jgi:hypothetical protein